MSRLCLEEEEAGSFLSCVVVQHLGHRAWSSIVLLRHKRDDSPSKLPSDAFVNKVLVEL